MHPGRKYEVMHAFQGQDTMQPCKESLGGVVTAKQTQHCRCLWEGRGCEIQPNSGVDFGEVCALECGIQLNGAVDFWVKTV